MAEPFYTILRVLHVGGGWVGFLAAPFALLAVKGARRHILAGRCFVAGLGTGVTAGTILALAVLLDAPFTDVTHPDPIIGLVCFGGMTLFFIGSGYLAPRIARGSRASYWCDRALTVLGALASLGMIGFGLQNGPFASQLESALFGGLGLAVARMHARWRGPADPTRWRAEHFTSLIAAYTVAWEFIVSVALGIPIPPLGLATFPVLGGAAIVWARRRFGAEAGGGDANLAPAPPA